MSLYTAVVDNTGSMEVGQHSCQCSHDHQTYIEKQHGPLSIRREQNDPVLSYKLTRNVIEVAITAALSFSKLKGAVAFFSLSSL